MEKHIKDVESRKERDCRTTSVRDIFKNTAKHLETSITGTKGIADTSAKTGIAVTEDIASTADTADMAVSGWVRTIRDSKAFAFIELNDGTFFRNLQIVVEEAAVNNYSDIIKLPVGSAISARGMLVPTPGSRQPFELKAAEVTVEGLSTPDYPLQKKRHSFEYLRTIAHLRPRTNTFAAVFRIRSLAGYAIHKFFQEKNFVNVHTPIITGSDCEGAGAMFRVTTLDFDNFDTIGTAEAIEKGKGGKGKVDFSKDFFGKETSLTVSGQLSAEAYSMAFRNVYTFGPTFRAENSNTARHAAEFWMIEPEIAFAGLKEDMDLAEQMLKFVISYVLENAPEEMKFCNDFIDNTLIERLKGVVASDFGHVTYTEAVDLLLKAGEGQFEYPVKWGCDLQTEHERYLTEKLFKKPVFVTDYPKDIKAFYMRMNDDGRTVAAMDLLVPVIGEIIGGSQREERLDMLEKRMDEMGLGKEDYWWYLDLRKYGGTKHAGFGLGFERAIMYLTGMGNIRDVVPYPRTVKSAEF